MGTQKPSIKSKLLQQGVKKLKQFGFTNVTKKNILTDDIYRLYFTKMLHLNQEHCIQVTKEIDVILRKMENKKPSDSKQKNKK